MAAFTVGGAEPGDMVYFAYSLAGAGPTVTPRGISVDLSAPVSLIGSSIQAGSDGTATLQMTIPGRAVGRHVWVQGVVRRGNQFFPSMLVNMFVQ